MTGPQSVVSRSLVAWEISRFGIVLLYLLGHREVEPILAAMAAEVQPFDVLNTGEMPVHGPQSP